MTPTLTRVLAGGASVAALALGTAAPAIACNGPHGSARAHHAQATALTGSTLTSASTAALDAVPGGTVTTATTAPAFVHVNDAAYKVHVTKPDGSKVDVIENADFTVLAVKAAHNCAGAGLAGRHAHGHRAWAHHRQ